MTLSAALATPGPNQDRFSSRRRAFLRATQAPIQEREEVREEEFSAVAEERRRLGSKRED